MNLEQKQALLKKLGYSDSEIKEILEKSVDPAYLDEDGAFPFEEEEEYFERKWHKTVDESFDDMCKKLGRIPTLQEFMETGYSKTSYYRARQQYKLGLEKQRKIKESEERYTMTKKNKNKHRR